jgi:hypothetical protein
VLFGILNHADLLVLILFKGASTIPASSVQELDSGEFSLFLHGKNVLTLPSSLDEALQDRRFKDPLGREHLKFWLEGVDSQNEQRRGTHTATMMAEVYKSIDDHRKGLPVREDFGVHTLHPMFVYCMRQAHHNNPAITCFGIRFVLLDSVY